MVHERPRLSFPGVVEPSLPTIPSEAHLQAIVESMGVLKDIGVIPYSAQLRRRWTGEPLWQQWAKQYPFLFDDLDRESAKNQHHMGYHFVEWLAAITLYTTTSFHSCLGKLDYQKHRRKREIFKRYAPPTLQDLVLSRGTKGAQCPDLFAFLPGSKDWFFCEVKGPGDRLRPSQQAHFKQIASASRKPVCVLRLRELS